MKSRFCSPPALATLIVALIWGLLAIGPYMRETDEAWLLDGGMNIADGHPEITRSEFNFDKQFVSYYLAGFLFKCLPRPFTGDTLVLAGNLLGMILFWGSLYCLLASSSRRLPLACALPVILTPCFLVYSPFYASAFTSVSLILILAVFLDRRKGGILLCPVSFLLAFGAVGARLDAIFLLPLLAMLHSRRPTFVSVLKNPATWLMAAGGLAAFVLGRKLYPVIIVDFVAVTMNLKQYLAHIVFGLGATTLLLFVALLAVGSARRIVRSALWLSFLGLGLVLPMGYYSFQLLTPRHCTVGAVSVIIFLCARRGRLILQNYLEHHAPGTAIKTVLVAAAVLPVFLGVNLADLYHPRLTCTRPTLLPTGAGVAPTGAYLAFASRLRQNHGCLDHNPAIWMAAKDTSFQPGPDGAVHFLASPVEAYFRFAIRLQNQKSVPCYLGDPRWPDHFYAETRSLMRYQFVYSSAGMPLETFLTKATFTPATKTDWHGITILLADSTLPADTNSPYAPLWAFNSAFGSDEFRLEPLSILGGVPPDLAGKKLVIASRNDFHVNTSLPAQASTLHNSVMGDWHVVEISPLHAGEKIDLSAPRPSDVSVAVSAFPAWLSLGKK